MLYSGADPWVMKSGGLLRGVARMANKGMMMYRGESAARTDRDEHHAGELRRRPIGADSA